MLESVGPYKVLERLGWSSLGDVYRGRDVHGRTVAIKIVPSAIVSVPELRARFVRDAHSTAQVSHPNIAELYQVIEEPDTVYLVYEFVQGESLQTVMAGQPLNPRRAVAIGIEVADALAEAHAAHVVHGRMTADSIVVTPKGRAKVLDLGVAAWAAAPLVQEDNRDAAGRRDVASLGALLFEMLTGAPLPAGTILPVSLAPTVPPEIDKIVTKALDAGQLDASAAGMAAELRGVAERLDSRRELAAPPPPAANDATVRRSVAAWAAFALVVLAAAVLWWYITHA